jgi:hypothetical protein
MSGIFDPLKQEIESDLEHFRRSYNIPERHTYKYTDGSGATGYIVTDKPIHIGPGKALNVHIFFGGGSKEVER